MKRSLRVVFILMLFSKAHAVELVDVNTSVRALGMGNAYSAIVADKDAIFYNPAQLSQVTGINLTIIDPYAGTDGQDVQTTYNNLSDTSSSSAAFASALKQLYGQRIWFGGGGKAAIAIPYLGFAAYDALSASAYLNNPAYPNLNLNFINDYGFAAAGAFPVAPWWDVGLTGKRITRIGASFPVGVSTIANLNSTALQNSIDNQGVGYSIDFGSSFTAPTPTKPTLSFVWKSMGTTKFTQDVGSQPPPPIRDNMIIGLGADLHTPGLDIRPAADFTNLNWYEEPLGKKVHLGVEFDFPVLSFRGGFSQGYYTVGVGVDLAFIRIDAATYGVELGEYAGQQEDRRYIIQATIELGLDPNISLGSSDKNGHSRLKQRR